MKKATYKKIDERVEYITIHHDETIDELGNIIPAYDEVVDKVISIMGVVYEDMDDIPLDEDIVYEKTLDEKLEDLKKVIYNLETETLINSINNEYYTMLLDEGVF